MEWLILVVIGLIAGTFGSLVGLGGGIIVVPSLLFVNSLGILSHQIEPKNAVGISLMVIIFTAIASTLYNYKQKRVDVKSGLFFFIASGPAAFIGGLINQYIMINYFYILFGIVMIFITYMLSTQKNMKPKKIKWDVTREYIDNKGIHHKYGYNKVLGFIITGIAGLLAGIFGIGGGAILVPMMVILFSFPAHVATATSMFIILMSVSLGSISHIIQGNAIYIYVLVIGIGAYTGGKLGAYVSSKMSSKALIIALRIVIIIVAIQMIYKGLTV